MEITGTFYCSNCSKNTSLILGSTRNAAGGWFIYKELDSWKFNYEKNIYFFHLISIFMGEENGKGWVQNSDNETKYECKNCSFSSFPLTFIPENKLKEIKDNKIKELNDEIKKLKNQLKNQNNANTNNNHSNEEKKDFKIIFKTNDGSINYTLECNENDKFTDLEDKLFEKYSSYSDKDVSFNFNGKKIKERKTLKENKISNGGTIIINFD